MSNVPHVLVGLAAIQRELATVGIGKDSTNAGQGFKFRSVDATLLTLAGMLADNKILLFPHIRHAVTEQRTTSKGSVMNATILTVDYVAHSAVDGSSVPFGSAVGEGMDSGDKATSKAESMAYKYAIFLGFCVPTEGVLDDSDAHSPHLEAPAPVPAPTPAPKAKAAPKPKTKKAPAEAAAAPETPAEPAPAPEAGDEFTAVLEAVEGCTDLDTLKGLRAQVAALSGHIRYGELKDAFTYVGKQLTTKA